MTSCWKRLSIL